MPDDMGGRDGPLEPAGLRRPRGEPGPASPLDRFAVAVATVGGAGRSPLAPGTVASAITVAVLAVVPFTQTALVGFFILVTLGGIWASERAERTLAAGKDPGLIVIDEVAGMTLSVLFLPRTLPVLLAGFVLFRTFDVVKPFPANVSQRLPGGGGVMADDLIAGVYALVILIVSRRMLGWP